MIINIIPGDYIINAPMQFDPWTVQSDFVCKAIQIKNDSELLLTMKGINFQLYAEGRKVKEINYEGDALENLIQHFPDKIKFHNEWDTKVMVGREKFWDIEKLSEGINLQPNQEIGILNEYFIVIYPKPIDQVILSVEHWKGSELLTEQRTIPVIAYQTKNAYTFPVKGVWQVNGNYDCYGAHRTQYSMEFAFDLGKVDTDTVYEKDEDYIWFGKEILAIGDGEVVECFNDATLRVNFPHDAEQDPKVLEERKQFVKQHGRTPLQCGNYVVIRQDNGEYSFYGHLIYQSVTVKQGDMVKQGQVIGRIGNTGKSACPHLHFQLMNGQDYSTSRGLPCHFTNITDAQRRRLHLVNEEYTIVIAI
jgi:hypothetical protein